ncbi:MAG: tetratricopeptide repeat protein [Chloroflexi bacterium]|nr:tetratricopeptide repeat protein [Chloroflexota bacterium]
MQLPVQRSLLVVLLSVVAILGPTNQPYLELLFQADAHARRLERTAAIATYQQAADLMPGFPQAHLGMARVYVSWNRVPDAITSLNEAEHRGAPPIEVGRLRLEVLRRQGNWSSVLELASVLSSLTPGDRYSLHALGDALLHTRNWVGARVIYQRLIADDPSDSRAQERLGILLLGRAEASQYLYAAHTELADQLIATLSGPGAASEPAYMFTQQSVILLAAREWPLAVRLLEHALELSPAYPDALVYLGYALDQMDREEEAERRLLEAVALAPESVVAHTMLGMHYRGTGRLREARAHFETAYDLDPTNAALCVEIGHTWAEEGRYAAAEIWYEEAVSLEPAASVFWSTLATFYVTNGIDVPNRGTAAASRYVELAPDDALAHDLLGWAQYQQGNFTAARAALERAITIDSELASAHFHLGQVMRELGAWVEVSALFQRAIDLDTDGVYEQQVARTLMLHR